MSCNFDYVEVSYPSREAFVEDKFCGSSIPEMIISPSNTMNVKFASDHSVTKQGFSAVWSKFDGFDFGYVDEFQYQNQSFPVWP